MNIIFVAAECEPFIKVGGLADVVGTLPQVLHQLGGHHIVVIVPHYGIVKDSLYGIEHLETFDLSWNGAMTKVEVSHINNEGVDTYFLRGWPYFASAETFIYHSDEGINVGRYLFFCAAALAWSRRLAERDNFKPDLFHIHDWHAAPVAYLLEQVFADDTLLGSAATLFSIHNMMYQGWGIGWHLERAGLPPINSSLLHALGKADNCLAIGIGYSTMLSTVSETYAREITTVEGGYGLDPLLHSRLSRMIGIVNGIDIDRWNPATSTAIPVRYTSDTLDRRLGNKLALQAELGLAERADVPIAAIVTRLVDQKGIDILIPAVRHVMYHRDMQFVVLGSGMAHYEEAMRQIATDYGGRAAAETRFNEPLAERIYAGSDLFLMPSLFEPCGIGQMIAMRYGSLPVVRRVGGLADTVDSSSGFLFGSYDMWALVAALDQALDIFAKPAVWSTMQKAAMNKDFAWESSARRYLELYRISVDLH